MKPRKPLVKIIVLLLFSLNCYAQSGLRYPIQGKKIRANDLCGNEICSPGSIGKLLHYTKDPYSPEINNNTTINEIALQVIGKINGDILRSFDFRSCENKNMFNLDDVVQSSYKDGLDVSYSLKKNKSVNILAAIKANLNDIKLLNDDISNLQLDNIKAKLSAIYENISDGEFKARGKYYEFQLSDAARLQFLTSDDFKNCRESLQNDPKKRIVLSAGIVYFDVYSSNRTSDALISELNSELVRLGVNIDLSFYVKKELAKNLVISGSTYQVVVVRHAGYSNDNWIEIF